MDEATKDSSSTPESSPPSELKPIVEPSLNQNGLDERTYELRTRVESKTDTWQRVDILAKAVGSLLLPVVIFVLGQRYTTQQSNLEAGRRQQELNDLNETRKVDRVATFLTHLTSDKPSERLLALRMLQRLAATNQFPPELLPAIIEVVNDENAQVAKAASGTLAAAAVNNRDVADAVAKAVQTRAPGSDSIARAVVLDPKLAEALPNAFSVIRYPLADRDIILNVAVTNADNVVTRVTLDGTQLAHGEVSNFTIPIAEAVKGKGLAILTVVTNFSLKQFTVTYTLRGGSEGEVSRKITRSSIGPTHLNVVVILQPSGI